MAGFTGATAEEFDFANCFDLACTDAAGAAVGALLGTVLAEFVEATGAAATKVFSALGAGAEMLFAAPAGCAVPEPARGCG